tara:strand:+ start:78 stop:254 length:177 start_codon:yes stop_codon:yes gene_type:complete
MSFLELIFIVFVCLGLIPNAKLITYYKNFKSLINNPASKRETIGDKTIDEEWEWIEGE